MERKTYYMILGVSSTPIAGYPEADSLRAVWVRAGLEQARLTVAA
jgi:hypothetical protein